MRSLATLPRSRAFFVHWLVLFVFWCVLSGIATPFHLIVGLLCCGAVALLTYDMQLVERADARQRALHFFALPWHRLALYAVWLLQEIVRANWAVLKVVFDPRLPADPALIVFHTRLQSALGRTILANSITLTPGTITVDVNGEELLVHALVAGDSAVDGIASIERHIARALVGIEPDIEPDLEPDLETIA